MHTRQSYHWSAGVLTRFLVAFLRLSWCPRVMKQLSQWLVLVQKGLHRVEISPLRLDMSSVCQGWIRYSHCQVKITVGVPNFRTKWGSLQYPI